MHRPTASLRALLGLCAALVVLGCDRARFDERVESIAPDTAAAMPDHTDAEPAAAGDADTAAATGSIAVFFSRLHDGDPAVAEDDPDGIDRHAAAFIARARRTIDCAFYELESDRIADALVDAHRRGVRVRMVGESDYRDNPEARRVVGAGIPVIWDERSALMHDKFIVVDDEAVWTGSYNLTDNCSFRNDNNAVAIGSRALAANYRSEFEEMFVDASFGPRSPSRTPSTLVEVDGASIYNYFAPEDDVPTKLLRFVRAARRSIHVMAFSFTDTTLANALIARRADGLDVRVLLESRGSSGAYSVLARLRDAGVEVATDANRYVMHHKVILVDSTWTITGSYNFTGAAARSNDENILIIKSPAIARRYEGEFMRLEAAARRAARATAMR